MVSQGLVSGPWRWAGKGRSEEAAVDSFRVSVLLWKLLTAIGSVGFLGSVIESWRMIRRICKFRQSFKELPCFLTSLSRYVKPLGHAFSDPITLGPQLQVYWILSSQNYLSIRLTFKGICQTRRRAQDHVGRFPAMCCWLELLFSTLSHLLCFIQTLPSCSNIS